MSWRRGLLCGGSRFHDLRHTCAPLLLSQGVPPRVVMEVRGTLSWLSRWTSTAM
jgi:integrase